MSTAAISVVGQTLEIDRKYKAPRDLLFEVWSQPKHIVNWWGPNDYTLTFCELDFRVDGRYRFCMRSPDGVDHWLRGEYREIVEPERIVFRWVRENADGSPWCDTEVTVSFEELHENTRFRLSQIGFESVEHRDQHRGGLGRMPR